MPRASRSSSALRVGDDIVPIAERKAHLSEVVRGLSARRRPVVVTQNGKAAAVLLSPAEFDSLGHESRFVAAVEEGLADVKKRRVISDAELEDLLDDRFGALPKSSRACR